MSTRRRLARERLEIYLMQLILAYRYLILIVGILLLIYAVALMFTDLWEMGYLALLPAVFLILLGNSYRVTVYTARLAAWISTLGERDS